MLLTVFLKHDQSRPLAELNAQLAKQGFYKAFPPPGVEVVSWTVTMGIGQIVVLRLPASRLREVNRVLEDTAWGAYRTEFYPTYDYKAIGLGSMSGRSDGKRVLARDRRLRPGKPRGVAYFVPVRAGAPGDFSQMHHKSFIR